MPSAAYYRAMARECLALAEFAEEAKQVDVLKARARGYFALAKSTDDDQGTWQQKGRPVSNPAAPK